MASKVYDETHTDLDDEADLESDDDEADEVHDEPSVLPYAPAVVSADHQTNQLFPRTQTTSGVYVSSVSSLFLERVEDSQGRSDP
jgi:hypothetical protein